MTPVKLHDTLHAAVFDETKFWRQTHYGSLAHLWAARRGQAFSLCGARRSRHVIESQIARPNAKRCAKCEAYADAYRHSLQPLQVSFGSQGSFTDERWIIATHLYHELTEDIVQSILAQVTKDHDRLPARVICSDGNRSAVTAAVRRFNRMERTVVLSEADSVCESGHLWIKLQHGRVYS